MASCFIHIDHLSGSELTLRVSGKNPPKRNSTDDFLGSLFSLLSEERVPSLILGETHSNRLNLYVLLSFLFLGEMCSQ